jgi:hypothetical protein
MGSNNIDHNLHSSERLPDSKHRVGITSPFKLGMFPTVEKERRHLILGRSKDPSANNLYLSVRQGKVGVYGGAKGKFWMERTGELHGEEWDQLTLVAKPKSSGGTSQVMDLVDVLMPWDKYKSGDPQAKWGVFTNEGKKLGIKDNALDADGRSSIRHWLLYQNGDVALLTSTLQFVSFNRS